MGSTGIVLVCLTTFHYLHGSDAYSVSFTPGNDMLGQQQIHSRKSNEVDRKLIQALLPSMRNLDEGYPLEPNDGSNMSEIESNASKLINQASVGISNIVSWLEEKLQNIQHSKNTKNKPVEVYKYRQFSRNGMNKRGVTQYRSDSLDLTDVSSCANTIVEYLLSMQSGAKKALDIVSDTVNQVFVTSRNKIDEGIKTRMLESLQSLRDNLDIMIHSAVDDVSSDTNLLPSERQSRSIASRTNTRSGHQNYLSTLNSQKRSKLGKYMYDYTNSNAPVKKSQMRVNPNPSSELQDCIRSTTGTNGSHILIKCIAVPLLKYLKAMENARAHGLRADEDPNVRPKSHKGYNLEENIAYPLRNIWYEVNANSPHDLKPVSTTLPDSPRLWWDSEDWNSDSGKDSHSACGNGTTTTQKTTKAPPTEPPTAKTSTTEPPTVKTTESSTAMTSAKESDDEGNDDCAKKADKRHQSKHDED